MKKTAEEINELAEILMQSTSLEASVIILREAMEEYAQQTSQPLSAQPPEPKSTEVEDETKALNEAYAQKILRQSKTIQEQQDYITALEFNNNQYNEQIQELSAAAPKSTEEVLDMICRKHNPIFSSWQNFLTAFRILAIAEPEVTKIVAAAMEHYHRGQAAAPKSEGDWKGEIKKILQDIVNQGVDVYDNALHITMKRWVEEIQKCLALLNTPPTDKTT